MPPNSSDERAHGHDERAHAAERPRVPGDERLVSMPLVSMPPNSRGEHAHAAEGPRVHAPRAHAAKHPPRVRAGDGRPPATTIVFMPQDAHLYVTASNAPTNVPMPPNALVFHAPRAHAAE